MFGFKKKIDKIKPVALIKEDFFKACESWASNASWLGDELDRLPQRHRRIQIVDDIISAKQENSSQEFLSTMHELRDWLVQLAEYDEQYIVEIFQKVKDSRAKVEALRKQLDERNA